MDNLLSQNGIRLNSDELEIDESTPEFHKLKEIAFGLEKSEEYFQKYSSYKMKGIFERCLKDVTDGEINHVHNGDLIKAMILAGHEWKRCSQSSRNVFFKISPRSLKAYECYMNGFDMGLKVKSEKISSEEQGIG